MASSKLLDFLRAFPLLYQASESSELISIVLSNAAIASSDLVLLDYNLIPLAIG